MVWSVVVACWQPGSERTRQTTCVGNNWTYMEKERERHTFKNSINTHTHKHTHRHNARLDQEIRSQKYLRPACVSPSAALSIFRPPILYLEQTIPHTHTNQHRQTHINAPAPVFTCFGKVTVVRLPSANSAHQHLCFRRNTHKRAHALGRTVRKLSRLCVCVFFFCRNLPKRARTHDFRLLTFPGTHTRARTMHVRQRRALTVDWARSCRCRSARTRARERERSAVRTGRIVMGKAVERAREWTRLSLCELLRLVHSSLHYGNICEGVLSVTSIISS